MRLTPTWDRPRQSCCLCSKSKTNFSNSDWSRSFWLLRKLSLTNGSQSTRWAEIIRQLGCVPGGTERSKDILKVRSLRRPALPMPILPRARHDPEEFAKELANRSTSGLKRDARRARAINTSVIEEFLGQ